MSEKGIIDSALYRPIDGGNFYDKYIPSSTCKSSYLGAGDTYFSMEGIKANILKNHSQCAQLAPLLKKVELQKTITAIYDFLYNHIQYKADGSDQNLRSPACSWHVRKKGIDCKSYSIFAGCILACLGIKFYIRKIKQPSMLPNEFTHVYIVVPKNQKTGSLKDGYHVIDATKHTNTEAIFSEKNDVFMDKLDHYGLQAPAVRRNTRKRGLRGTEAPEAGFCQFTSMLKKAGVKPAIVNRLDKHINDNIANGGNPQIYISKDGLLVDRTLYPFINNSDQAVQIPEMYTSVRSRWQTGAIGLRGDTSGGSGTGTGSTTEPTNDSKFWDKVWGEVEEESDGWLDSIIDWIKDFVNCWGSSATPKTVKAWKKDKIQPWVNIKFGLLRSVSPKADQTLTAQINMFMRDLAVIKAHQLFHKKESAKDCGKKANQAMADFIEAIELHMLTAYDRMKADYTITTKSVTVTANKLSIPGLADNWKGETTYATYTERNFKLKPGAAGGIVIDPLPGGGGTSTGGNTGGGTQTGGTQTGSGTGTQTGNNYPPEYNSLSAVEKTIYERYAQDKNLVYYNSYRSQNPSYTPSAALLKLLKLPATTTLPYVPTKTPVTVQKAGMNGLLVFGLIAGGLYMAYKNKKKSNKGK